MAEISKNVSVGFRIQTRLKKIKAKCCRDVTELLIHI